MAEGRERTGTVETDVDSANRGKVGSNLRGLVFPMYGGDLRGWCRIGAFNPAVQHASNGPSMIRVAEHSSAQCALVMALDGRVGVSWTGEFLTRYSHLTHVLESAAVWADVLGWQYADAIHSDPEAVLRVLPDARLIAEASGEHVRWWHGDGYAIYSEIQLTASPGSLPMTLILAQDGRRSAALREPLQSQVDGSRPSYFLSTRREVSLVRPDPPEAWGRLEPADEIVRELH